MFSEPWEANAFALVVGLHEKGLFTWNEWAEVLGETLKTNDNETTYYHSWLDALETIVSQKSLVKSDEISVRKAEWQKALMATPHGKPIELKNGTS